MSFVSTKAKFHVALDGVGLILQGAPTSAAYKMNQAPIFNARFGEGDRDYNDLSQWWYLTQTDWSGGFKNTFPYVDDAKFYYSSNIDARTKPGTFRLERQVALTRDNNVGGNDEVFDVRVYDVGGAAETLYLANNGFKVLGSGTAKFASGAGNPENAHAHRGYMWILGTAVATTNTPGTAVAATDQTTSINAVISGSVSAAGAAVSVGSTIYIFGIADDSTIFCVKTAVAAPSSSADYSLVFQIPFRNNTGASVVGAQQIGDQIVFLIEGSPQWTLYSLDVATGIASVLREFDGCVQMGVYSKGGRYVQKHQGKILITVITSSTLGTGQIWHFDGTILTKIYDTDEVKNGFTSSSIEAVGSLRMGAAVHKEYAYWGNLVWNGTYFFNFIKDINDSITNRMVSLGSDGDLLYLADLTVAGGDDQTSIFNYDDDGTVYKQGANSSAFLVFSQHDKLQSIDKLMNAINIGFEGMASGQEIKVYYTTSAVPTPDISGWTLLGSATFAIDGASATFKNLPFPVGITAKKIWFRVNLIGGGSNTPAVTDFTLEYLPMPDYKKQWSLNANLADELKRMDGSLVEMVGRELKGRLERAWWTKSQLDYQDLDYATTLLNGALNTTDVTITVDDTYDFPEQGRARIDDEEITYTGKTPTSLTGVTRGARGTRAASHLDNAVINNAYRVIITDIEQKVATLLEDKNLEYVMGISLREV